MNSASDVSSYQGMNIPPETGKGEGERETGSTEKSLEGLARGRRVSPAAEGDAPAIASTGQGAGIMEEPSGRTLLRWEIAQEAPLVEASAMPVDSTGSEQTQLQHKLEKLTIGQEDQSVNERQKETMFSAMLTGFTNEVGGFIGGLIARINRIRKGAAILEPDKTQYKEMFNVINRANELRNDGKLEEASNVLKPILDRVTNDKDVYRCVGSSAYRCKAHILCEEKDIETALIFFEKAEQAAEVINYPERFYILHLMLGIDIIDGDGLLPLFRPEDFYKGIKDLLVDDEKHRKGLLEFEEKVKKAKVLHDGIKAVFSEENVNPETPVGWDAVRFKQSIAELTKPEEAQPNINIFMFSDQILRFTKNLWLIEHGHFDEAEKAISDKTMSNKNKLEGVPYLKHLDRYILCQILRKSGDLDQAVRECQLGVSKGHPFLDYYDELCQEQSCSERSCVAVAR